MSHPRYYCYRPHSAAIAELLKKFGFNINWMWVTVIGDDDSWRLAGIRGGIFINISNHHKSVPEEIWRKLQHSAVYIIEISDELIRKEAD